ncbi:hypothetical protein BDV38DRAFT_266966 [Aspergillus pseudotamarii]|uniref:Tat pathway signal sequence n=1 Tax=Aspergillus pseudotamarii TaxID=132259 RepID=A0A5N6TCJ1_ASPPS|nr:uncharacterized protein BDV38DRAFT_266966 [Aspergillus pseudotamarii]KAE8143841.1 hypothetical protein BDV38DRAFT_266966 [Aspergillus pseudotamarii]
MSHCKTKEIARTSTDGERSFCKGDSERDSERGLLTDSLPAKSGNCWSCPGPERKRLPWLSLWMICLNILIFCGSILFLLSPFSSRACLSHLSDQDKWKATSYYAPILERFDIPRVVLTTNGSLYDSKPPSIMRMPQGDEADAEWSRISSGVFPILMSADEVRKLGKDPTLAVRVPDEFGYGPDAYLAQTEVFHLLHCLDMLRKEISYEHYYYPKFGNNPDAQHTAHITHCIDILAQFIKCQGSVDVILFNWVGGWDQPFPDFMNKHNSVATEVFEAMKEPPGDYPVQPNPSIAPFVPTAVPGS